MDLQQFVLTLIGAARLLSMVMAPATAVAAIVSAVPDEQLPVDDRGRPLERGPLVAMIVAALDQAHPYWQASAAAEPDPEPETAPAPAADGDQ